MSTIVPLQMSRSESFLRCSENNTWLKKKMAEVGKGWERWSITTDYKQWTWKFKIIVQDMQV